MMRRRVFLLLFLFAVVIAHPTDISEGSGSSDLHEGVGLTLNDDLITEYNEAQGAQREEALAKLQQIFGIPEPSDAPNPHKIPPQFMIELYNTIADPSGVTRGKNPYNAKIVRSFTERDSTVSHYYQFNISGLEMNESVLEAELHLYRKRTPLKAMHPAVLSSPYYLIRVYQVLDEHQLDIPDLHRLLNVHYVGAHASGWQVFNVKQAVLSWISGAPNLGLLVTASNLFGDDAAVHFSRRSDHRHSKQPILVLFNDDGKDSPAGENIVPHYYKYANDLEEEDDEEEAVDYKGHKTDQDDDSSFESDKLERHMRDKEGGLIRKESTGAGTEITRQEDDDHHQAPRRERRNAPTPKKGRRVVSKNAKVTEALSSMDIYERAVMRKKLARSRNVVRTEPLTPDPAWTSRQRRARSTPESTTPKTNVTKQTNTTECARHELYVDFEEIGWSGFIIAPNGYSAYHCKGHCNFPLSQGQHPTNHATVQSLVHMLREGSDVNLPCCVPTKLLGISILYFVDDSNVVLKLYHDMVADRCGCH